MSESNDQSKTVRNIKLQEIIEEVAPGQRLLKNGIEMIQNIKISLSVSLGKANMSVGELLDLNENSILHLDRRTNDPVDIILDGKVIARGSIVAVDDDFGVKITEISNQLP